MRADRSGWLGVLQYVLDGLERMLSARFAEFGLIEDRRAYERSLTLLMRCLSPTQRAEFKRSRAFTVRGKGGQQYRVTHGTTANIELLTRSGRIAQRLCAGPVGIPTPAVMLAQKLMLESQEAEFLRIAYVRARTGDGRGDEPAGFLGS